VSSLVLFAWCADPVPLAFPRVSLFHLSSSSWPS
jgi:hypothetical protein